jgi:hypothetical protein
MTPQSLNTESLSDLLVRVEGAGGPDRYIDFWTTVLLWEPDAEDDIAMIEADIELVGIEEMWIAMPFSGSLDAALALVERVLPEANCHGYDKTPDHVEAYVSRNCAKDGHWLYEGRGATPALALLAAMLKALLADARERSDTGKTGASSCPGMSQNTASDAPTPHLTPGREVS